MSYWLDVFFCHQVLVAQYNPEEEQGLSLHQHHSPLVCIYTVSMRVVLFNWHFKQQTHEPYSRSVMMRGNSA